MNRGTHSGERDGARAPSAPDLLWLALALGLVVGLGEAAAVAWRAGILDRVTRLAPHVTWMAPVGYALLFALLSIPLMLVRRDDRMRIGAAIFLTLGLVGWSGIPMWGLHAGARWLLSAGIAWVLSDRIARFSRVGVAARTVTLGLAVVVAGLSAFSLLRDRRAERIALEALGAPPDAPNVLLVILDTVRAKSLGLYGGDPRVSPFLDRFGREAIVFDRAVSPAPWTLPSHASMFTGRWPHELSSGWDRPLDDAEPTLAEALAARGYVTAGFVANLLYTSKPMGLSRGFARYEDYPINLGQGVLAMSLGRQVATWDWLRHLLNRHELLHRKDAADVSAAFLEWLDTASPDRPFFAFLNFFDAHEPYEPPGDLRESRVPSYRRSDVAHRHDLLRGISARRIDKWSMSPDEVTSELALYEAAITGLDSDLSDLFQELEGRGLLASTLVIVTSDHGEQMGEHGLFGHHQSLYTPVTHVPLIIRPPNGVPEPVRVPRAVTLRDMAATVLDLIGVPGPRLPGESLATTWDERGPRGSLAVSELQRGLVEQGWYPIARGLDMQSLLSGTLYYICNPDGSEELYDLASDPDERMSLVGTAAGDQAVAAFRAAIAPVGAPPGHCPPPPDEAPRRPGPRR